MRSRNRLLDVACLVSIAGVVALFFWPVLLLGYWIPRGGGDLVSFLWPMARFTARSLRAGVVPLWNPYQYSGAPFIADNQSGVFYPLNMLVTAIVGEPSYTLMEALVAFHLWVAGVNAFALSRGLGMRRLAALYAGIAFALSDLFITHLGNLNLNATAAWLPLLILLTHRALTRHSAKWAAAAGIFVSIAALAGHAQMLLYSGLALGAYVLYRLVDDRRRGLIYAAQTVGLAVTIAAVGFAGAALTLLPAYEMAGHTGRGYLPYEEAARYSVAPQALVGLLVPGFYGRGPAGFWGPWDRVEVGYVGIATLLLAALGCCVWARMRWRKGAAQVCSGTDGGESGFGLPLGFFVILIIGGFLLALGSHTPLYRILYEVMPVFDQIRAPGRLVVLGDLGLVMVASFGLDQLLKGACRSDARWVALGALGGAVTILGLGSQCAQSLAPLDRVSQAQASVVSAATLLFLSGLIIWFVSRRTRQGWIIVVLVASDLIALGSLVEVEPNDPTLGFQHDGVVEFLRQDKSFFRIESATSRWQPDSAMVHSLYDIGGVYNPLGLAPYEAYRWAVGERGSPLYNLLGVKYILADKGSPPGDEGLTPVYVDDPDIDVYLNTSALPRALLVAEAEVVANHAAVWEAIHAQGFDPTKVVVLERGEPLNPGAADLEGDIAFIDFGLNEVEVRVHTTAPAYLVLSEVYYPGWRASLDDVDVEVLRADYVFRAVLVPPGDHVIRLWFAPVPWRIGAALSALTWCLVAIWMVFEMLTLDGCRCTSKGASINRILRR